MVIVRSYSAVHMRIAAELVAVDQADAATALEGQAVRFVHAGEGWGFSEAEERAREDARRAGKMLLVELVDEIAEGLRELAEEAISGTDGGQSAAGFFFELLHRVTGEVAPEHVGARVSQSVVNAAGGTYLPAKRTVVWESNLAAADRPGQSDREGKGSTTTEPPTSVVADEPEVKPQVAR